MLAQTIGPVLKVMFRRIDEARYEHDSRFGLACYVSRRAFE
jgi:hypothetical protein